MDPSQLPAQYGAVLGVVTLGGFAIQQSLQLCDIPVSWLIGTITKGGTKLPNGMTFGDFKKAIMTVLAFALSLMAVLCFDIGTLEFISDSLKGQPIDILVTALVLSAGTEGTNTLLKYFGYVKDARKPSEITVAIAPTTLTVAKKNTAQFIARVEYTTNKSVIWSVLQSNGGTIDQSGLYLAPDIGGTYIVQCVSPEDRTRPAFAFVTVQ